MTNLLSTIRRPAVAASRPDSGRPALMSLVMLLSITLPMLFHAACSASDPRPAKGYIEVSTAPSVEVPQDARGHLQLRSLGTGVTTAVHLDTLRAGTRLALPAGPYAVAWVGASERDALETEGASAASDAPASGGRSEALSAEPCDDAAREDAPVLSILPAQVTTLRVRASAAPTTVSLVF
jgi:hypothetical protein